MEGKQQIKEAIMRNTEYGESKHRMANGIRRVVWVPGKLDQEIENLRHKIGYTRSGFYRYAITRLMEQMLLSKRKEVRLQPWEEVVGTLKTIEENNQTISAIISCTQNLEIALPFPKDTPEATTIQNLHKLLGQRIALIKTDNPEKPLNVRTILRDHSSHKDFFTAIVASQNNACRFIHCFLP